MRTIAPVLLYFTTFLLCIGLAVVPSCGAVTDCKKPENATSAKCSTINGSVECAGSDFEGAVSKFGPVVEDIIHGGLKPDGSVDYSSIESKLIDAGYKYGGCVLSYVFSNYIFNKHAPAPGQPVTAPTPDEAKATFAKLRANLWPGMQFKTPAGVL